MTYLEKLRAHLEALKKELKAVHKKRVQLENEITNQFKVKEVA